mgnify:CR=1 FL=1
MHTHARTPHTPTYPQDYTQLDYMPFDARTKRTESTIRDPEGRVYKVRVWRDRRVWRVGGCACGGGFCVTAIA